MPSSLLKTRKHIAKKRKGEVNALHEKFRDSRRLHKASARDQRLEKLSVIRSKKEQPIGKQREVELCVRARAYTIASCSRRLFPGTFEGKQQLAVQSSGRPVAHPDVNLVTAVARLAYY